MIDVGQLKNLALVPFEDAMIRGLYFVFSFQNCAKKMGMLLAPARHLNLFHHTSPQKKPYRSSSYEPGSALSLLLIIGRRGDGIVMGSKFIAES